MLHAKHEYVSKMAMRICKRVGYENNRHVEPLGNKQLGWLLEK